MQGKGPHLAGDGQAISRVDALNDASDVLDGGHQGCKLVMAEVCKAGDDACGYDEDICRRECEKPEEERTRWGED